jgi:hypothetical protein
MYVFIYTHTYIHARMNKYICTHTYIHTYTHTYISVSLHQIYNHCRTRPDQQKTLTNFFDTKSSNQARTAENRHIVEGKRSVEYLLWVTVTVTVTIMVTLKCGISALSHGHDHGHIEVWNICSKSRSRSWSRSGSRSRSRSEYNISWLLVLVYLYLCYVRVSHSSSVLRFWFLPCVFGCVVSINLAEKAKFLFHDFFYSC